MPRKNGNYTIGQIDTILDNLYHIGRIIETTSASFDPNGLLPGTWKRTEIYLLNNNSVSVSTNVNLNDIEIPVTGNGYTLGIWDGYRNCGFAMYNTGWGKYTTCGSDAYGLAPGNSYSVGDQNDKVIGVSTKSQLGSGNYAKSGLIATTQNLNKDFTGLGTLNTQLVYKWIRTN